MTPRFDAINTNMFPIVYGEQLVTSSGRMANSHFNIKDWPKLDYYVINYKGVQETHLISHTIKGHKAIKRKIKTKNVVCVYEFECQHTFWWNAVIDCLKGLGYEKILIIDGGFSLWTHFYPPHNQIYHAQAPFFFNLYQDTPIEFNPKRSKHFLSLTRRLKASRLRISIELLARGLEHNGIMSCGWCKEDANTWDETLPNKYRDMIPLHLKRKFPLDLGHQEYEQWTMTELGLHDTYINLIVETHTGNWGLTPNNIHETLSDRPHFTEKTTKCFAFYQLPVLLGTYKQVEALRSLNFDMFDDVIDHSYDLEPDLLRREKMVADEIERLCSKPLEEWEKFFTRNEKRFLANRQKCKIAYEHATRKIEKILSKFN